MGKLAAIKQFVPDRIMIFMLVFVSLAGAAYLVSVNNRSDHLTRRNFHSLNAIADNISRSLETLDAVVEFAEPACGNSKSNIFEVAGCIKEKLGGPGATISGGTISQIEEVEVKGESSPTDKEEVKSKGKVTSTKSATCKADEEVTDKGRKFYINHGSATLDGPIINKTYIVTQAEEGKAKTCLKLIIAYDVLNSDKAREGFFDSTVFAQYQPGEGVSQVVSNSSSRGVRVSPDDIRQLFSSRSEAVRLRTLQELEMSAANERAEAFTLGEGGASFSRPNDAPPIPFSQSTVATIEIGGQHFYAFIQPVVLDAKQRLESDLVIVGLVSTSRFNQDKYQLPYNLLYYLLLLLLTAGLVISLLHLALIGKRELLHRKNTLLANLSSLGLQAMAVLIIMQWISASDLNALLQSSNRVIFESIRTQFDRELDDRYVRLISRQPELLVSSCDDVKRVGFSSEKYRGVENFFLLDENGKNVGTYKSNRLNPASPGFGVADRNYFKLLVEGKGWIYQGKSASLKPQERRGYFLDRIESKADGEIATVLSTRFKSQEDDPIYPCIVTSDPPPVLAYTTHFVSLRNTVLPVGFGFSVFDNVTGQVLFHSDRRRSLRENFYQATDDSNELKAKVIAALPAKLNLDYKGEKIQVFVGPLKEGIPWSLAVYHRTSVPDILSFHFGLTGGILGLLGLVVLGFLAALLVGALGVTLTTEQQRETFRWRKILQLPRWMCPLRDRKREYRRLSLYFAAALPIYAGLVYYTDGFLLFWYFVPPLAALLVWHRLVRYELYVGEDELSPKFGRLDWQVRLIGLLTPGLALLLLALALRYIFISGGVRYAWGCAAWLLIVIPAIYFGAGSILTSNKPRKGLAVYRQTVTLFGIICAVFPTLMLLNHNYDLHEQLWVKYNHWAIVDRLKARYSHLVLDARTFKLSPSLTLRHIAINDWTGVYLPRTEIFSIDDSGSSSVSVEKIAPKRHIGTALPNVDNRGEYYNAYLLAHSVEADNCLRYRIDPALAPLFFDPQTSPKPNFSLSQFFSNWLPNLNDTSDMIRTFDQQQLQTPQHPSDAPQHKFAENSCVMHIGATFTDLAYPKVGHGVRGVEKGMMLEIDSKIGQAGGKIREEEIARILGSQELGQKIYRETHDRAGITYRIMNWYPHTRSPSSAWKTGLAFSFAAGLGAIGVLFYILNGWLISRFFTNAFEDGLYIFPPEDEDSYSPFTEGAVLVTAPGESLECFKKHCQSAHGKAYVDELTTLNLRNPVAMSHWTLLRSEATRTTIAFLENSELSDETLAPKFLDFLNRTYGDGDAIVIIAGLDLGYALTEAYTHKVTDLRNPYPLSKDNCLAWRAFLSDLPTFFLKPCSDVARRQQKRDLYQAWETSSNDEQMVLAALIYEDRTNPMNRETLNSLYRRSLIRTSNYGFTLNYPDLKPIIKARCSYEEYRVLRNTYENETWLTWKKPIIVVLTLLMVFVLFVARDQLSGVFSLIATVLTGAATVGLISERVRGFKGALFDETS